MANPLFSMLNQNNNMTAEMQSFVAEVKRLQSTFNGNPRDEVQKMLNSGSLTQEKFNEYAQIANQVMSMIN